MQIQVNSSNVSLFGFTARFDIFNRKVIFDTTALTTYNGAGASAVKIGFLLQDQDGIQLLTPDFTDATKYLVPSGSKIYTLDLSSLNYNFLFQTYQIQAVLLDGGNQYSTPLLIKNICQPLGLTDGGYVPGIYQVTPDCVNNTLTVKELTLLTYNNSTPSSKTTTGVLNYPIGTIAPVNFSGTPFSNNQVYTGRYVINSSTVGEYDFGDGIFVDVTYSANQQFDVTCNNKIADLLCCIQGVQKDYISNCNSARGKDAKLKLDKISSTLLTGLIKEINGQDASDEADYIREVLNCDCGATSVGQNQLNPINPAISSIVIVGAGGTTVPAPTINGTTKQFSIASNLYQVTKTDITDLAFTITTDTSTANTIKYKIAFNYGVMASSILSAISASPTLVSQLNALISAGTSLAGLNGSCVIDLTKSSYSLSQAINGSTLITSITINGTIYNAPANLNVNTPSSVQSWLNSLSLGVFSVSVNNSVLTILSVNNTNVLSSIALSNPTLTVVFASTNATLVSILQALINYVCTLTSLQIALANSLSLSLFDYSGNPVTVQYPSGTPQATYNLGISQAINNIVQRINTLTGITCATLKGIFADNPNAQWLSSDRLFGTLGGNCAGLTDQQIAKMVIAAISKYSDVKAAYCAISCITPGTCPDITALNLGVVNGNAVLYGVTWTQNPIASQTVTVKYRVHGQLNWIVSQNAVVISPNGNVSSNPPYVIAGTVAGQTYDVQVLNNCGGVGFIGQITTPANQVYSGSYRRDNSIYLICGDTPVTLYSSQPFGTGTTMYTNVGLTNLLTGFSLIADNTGAIYLLNSVTGVVGAPTGSNCVNGTAGSYILGNSTGSVCNGTPQTLYTSGVFAVGGTLYQDAALTTPVTGFSYVVNQANNHIYNLNSVNGQIGTDTGQSCNSNTVIVTSSAAGMQITNIAGITGFAPNPALPVNPGGSSVGTHSGFTGQISVTLTGTPAVNPENVSLTINGVLIQCINVTGAGVFTFNSVTVIASDIIRIDANLGSC